MQDWILPAKEDLIVEQWGQMPSCYNIMSRILMALTCNSAVPTNKNPKSCTPCTTEISVEQCYSLTVFESGLLISNNEETPERNEQTDIGNYVIL